MTAEATWFRVDAPWYRDPITDRQKKAILLIKAHLGIPFSGQYKGEAMKFIGEYYDLAKKMYAQGTSVEVVSNRKMAPNLLSKEDPWEEKKFTSF